MHNTFYYFSAFSSKKNTIYRGVIRFDSLPIFLFKFQNTIYFFKAEFYTPIFSFITETTKKHKNTIREMRKELNERTC